MRTGHAVLGGLLVLAVAVGTMEARAGDALDDVRASGVLSVGVPALGPPFDTSEDGRHVGFDADLLGEVAKEIGVGLRWVAPAGSRATGSGDAPLMDGPVPVTRAVRQRYRVLPPVVETSDALLKRRGDGRMSRPADVAGKAVGGVAGSPALAALRLYARTLPARPTIRDHAEAKDALADLVAGRVAAVAGDLPALALVTKARPDVVEVVRPPFGPPSYLAVVIAKDADHAALADAATAAILRMKADGRLAAMQIRWFGQAFDTPVTLP